jgi:hypothetical protein
LFERDLFGSFLANGALRVMAEAADKQSNEISTRRNEADKKTLAQVEKWMAIIREISRERPGPTYLRG